MKRNEVVIDGRLLRRGAIRYTPAGTCAIDMLIGHSSIQTEAGIPRKTQFEIEAVALGDVAARVSAIKLNQCFKINGFLARRSVSNGKIVLHIADIVALRDSARD